MHLGQQLVALLDALSKQAVLEVYLFMYCSMRGMCMTCESSLALCCCTAICASPVAWLGRLHGGYCRELHHRHPHM